MSVEMRILTCRLLEKMKLHEAYGKRLGLEDTSRVHGILIEKGPRTWRRKDRG